MYGREMETGVNESVSRALNSHLNSMHETNQVLDQIPASSLDKFDGEKVIELGVQISNQASLGGEEPEKPEKMKEEKVIYNEEQKQNASSPLIQTFEENGSDLGGEERRIRKGVRTPQIFEEVKKQLWLAGPLIAVNLLEYCLQVISVMFVGHLGKLPLSGASMATSFATVTGFSLLMGMGSALDTLCGQSYGAKQYYMLGIHTQRAMFVLSLVSIPLAFIWAYTGHILLALGQDPDISAEAGLYALFMIPCLFAFGLLQCLVRFLQSQNIVFPMMVSLGFTCVLHLPVCWILVFKSGLGNRGAALANSISYWINVLLLAIYVKFSHACKETWTGFSKGALHDVLKFIRLAIPSAIMVCLEMWSFELIVLLSGFLPNPKLETSVLSISLNTAAMVWMIPLGLSGAISTRVSNELGAGHPQDARLAVWVVLFMTITVDILIVLTMILLRGIWGYAYSKEEEVVRYLAKMIPLLATSCFLDGIQCVLSGIARGCGWQTIGAFVNLGAYYLVGIPSAIVLALVLHVGGRGLWMGIILALIVQVFSLIIITLRTNWEKEARNATNRVYDTAIPVAMA